MHSTARPNDSGFGQSDFLAKPAEVRDGLVFIFVRLSFSAIEVKPKRFYMNRICTSPLVRGAKLSQPKEDVTLFLDKTLYGRLYFIERLDK